MPAPRADLGLHRLRLRWIGPLTVGVLALALGLLPLGAAAVPDLSATVRFGRPDTGSPFPPPDGHDASSNAMDNLVPRTVVIARTGSVTFEIRGFHQTAIYRAGTEPDDITVPPFPPNLFVNDATNRLALGPLNVPPAETTWTSPMGTFDQPGRYLVICNVTPHFALVNMYGWVIVQ